MALQAAREESPRLSPDAAFVVQLGAGAFADDGSVSGRVEHVKTGMSEPFGSLEELLAFMKRFRAA